MERIFYNLDMAKAVRRIKPPPFKFTVDIRPAPNYIAVVVYEEQIMEYNDNQRAQVMEYLIMVKNVIESYGTRCEVDGIQWVGKGKSFHELL
jgi:hypothetical protein